MLNDLVKSIINSPEALSNMIVGFIGFAGVISTLAINDFIKRRSDNRLKRSRAEFVEMAIKSEIFKFREMYLRMSNSNPPDKEGIFMFSMPERFVSKKLIKDVFLLESGKSSALIDCILVVDTMHAHILARSTSSGIGYTVHSREQVMIIQRLARSAINSIDSAIDKRSFEINSHQHSSIFNLEFDQPKPVSYVDIWVNIDTEEGVPHYVIISGVPDTGVRGHISNIKADFLSSLFQVFGCDNINQLSFDLRNSSRFSHMISPVYYEERDNILRFFLDISREIKFRIPSLKSVNLSANLDRISIPQERLHEFRFPMEFIRMVA